MDLILFSQPAPLSTSRPCFVFDHFVPPPFLFFSILSALPFFSFLSCSTTFCQPLCNDPMSFVFLFSSSYIISPPLCVSFYLLLCSCFLVVPLSTLVSTGPSFNLSLSSLSPCQREMETCRREWDWEEKMNWDGIWIDEALAGSHGPFTSTSCLFSSFMP